MGRFADEDDRLVPAGTELPPPASAFTLLERLHVARALRHEQEVAVKEWLASHDAPPILRRSLERYGFPTQA